MSNSVKKDFLWSIVLSILGFGFVVNYIFMASMDVPTSDYIRIINNYINDVYDIKKFLIPDLIARVPLNYLLRIINVGFFGYSMFFDRIVGALGLSVFNFLIVKNLRKRLHIELLKNIVSIVLTIVIFSLIAWEMLLNGTGCVIFIFFALVVLLYEYYEEILYNKKKNIILFCILLFFSCTCCGSDYQVALLGTIIFFSFVYLLFVFIEKNKLLKSFDIGREMKFIITNKSFVMILVSCFIFILYYISNHVGYAGEYTIVGLKDVSLKDVLLNYTSYVFNYITKSLASIIIGVETFEYAVTLESLKEYHIVLVGLVLGLVILYIVFLILWKKLYKKYLFFVMIFFHGIASVGLVFLARFAFLNDHYGMSSRYAVQFMLVPVGIICLISCFLDEILIEKNVKQIRLDKKKISYIVSFSCIVFFLFYGRIITNLDELNKARARHFCYEQSFNLSKFLDDYPPSEENDQFLKNIFEYQRSADLIRHAFGILKEKKLNVYRGK